MSFLTHAWLLERYGPLLTLEQAGEVLHLEPGTLRNQIRAGTLGLPVIKTGRAPLIAAADLAARLEAMRTAVAA